MEEKYNLEVKGICQFEMKMDLTYRSIKGPTACKIKEVTWEFVDIEEYKGYPIIPTVIWYENFAVISIGKDPGFNDNEECLINEALGLNDEMLSYCDEESLAIIVSNRHMYCQMLVEMFREFFIRAKWKSYDGDNIRVAPTPFPF